MAVESEKATSGDKELRTDWPFTEGLTLGTTKLKDNYILRPEEESVVEDADWELKGV